MPTEPTPDGRKAKFIFAELDAQAADSQEALLDALENMFSGGHEKAMRGLLDALKHNSVVSRIATLLRAGQMQEAEDIVMGLNRRDRS